ncbi:MAG: hypothetical protein ACI9FU_002245 [Granulosicoccus sp.]|jgi:hypothetical protein
MIEGVGSNYGLIDVMIFFEFYNGFRCYGHGGIPLVYDYLYYCDFTVGIEKESTSELRIFPNPTEGVLHISNLTKPTQFSISNILGNEVMNGVISDGDKLDVSELPSGIYILNLMFEVPRSIKLIKQ